MGIAGERFQHENVLAQRRAHQSIFGRIGLKRGPQRVDGGKIQYAIAPLQRGQRLEIMRLQRLHQFGVKGGATARGAKRAVIGKAPGAACNLRKFSMREASMLPAVVFAVAGEGHMVDVEVEAHAHGVGGDDEIDLAVLVHLHLRIAGARRQRPQHHGGAAALAPDQLGDGINLVGGERDDGAALGQAADLALARKAQIRQARPCDDGCIGQQAFDQRPHGGGADHHRLLASAPVQQAISEDMAAIKVGGELDFIDGQKRHVEIARHRLHGRNPVTGVTRLDLFLAGDERNLLRPDAGDDLVVDLARQQAQRQADHAAGMAEHALNRQMGLTGVGGAEHCGDAARTLVAGGPGAVEIVQGHTHPPGGRPGASASAIAALYHQ